MLRDIALRGLAVTDVSEHSSSNEIAYIPADVETAVDITESDAPHNFDDLSERSRRELITESLTFTERDVEIVEMVSPLVSVNPRRVRRFIAVYAVVRARIPVESRESVAVAFATAALVGTPNTLGRELLSVEPVKPAETVGEWLDRLDSYGEFDADHSGAANFLKKTEDVRAILLVDVLKSLTVITHFALSMDG
jgi:hypothetical protein